MSALRDKHYKTTTAIKDTEKRIDDRAQYCSSREIFERAFRRKQDFKYIQVKIRSNNFEERVRPIKLDKNIL